VRIDFYPCGVGEFIVVYTEECCLMIDSGFKSSYSSFVRPHLNSEKNNKLWILSHTDEDHIGGIIQLINQGEERLLSESVNQVWFNHSSLDLHPTDELISVRQGILLRDKLRELEVLEKIEISTDSSSLYVGDICVDILSPSPDSLEKSKVKWQRLEENLIGASSDYQFTIEELLDNDFSEDVSVWNGGSISVLLTHEDKRIMMLADAHPSVIVEGLKNDPFNCSSEDPIHVDCVKVAHHGSKANTSIELLELIECRDWVFCADGSKHGFPHKECMARIVDHYKDRAEPTRLILNQDTPTYEQIFGGDEDAGDRYNFELIHLEDGHYQV